MKLFVLVVKELDEPTPYTHGLALIDKAIAIERAKALLTRLSIKGGWRESETQIVAISEDHYKLQRLRTTLAQVYIDTVEYTK